MDLVLGRQRIAEIAQDSGLSPWAAELATTAAAIIILIILSVAANFVAKGIILRFVAEVVRRTRNRWDDILVERQVFGRLSHLAPAVVIYALIPVTLGESPLVAQAIQRLTIVYMIIAGTATVYALLDALAEISKSFESFGKVPVKSYSQLVKIFIFVVAAVFVVATLLDRSPWGIVSGIGALTAVLLLIFRDSILGLVATVQLSGNDMVRVGDWIEMPSYNADGDVIDMSLHTVKVQNWDKTITTIPTHALISDSFRNWRGMQESGGRRIKRSIYIDMNTVRFVDEEMLQKYRKFDYLGEYVDRKLSEIEEYNRNHVRDLSEVVNGRRLTNLGTFRAYVESYLKRHSMISDEMTFLVRQLQPSDRGIPIEIYVFSRDIRWANYEQIQADIFDHLLAVIPEFGLRVYQAPSGNDVTRLGEQLKGR
jgi:miniconductance mechanosensitive channel